MAATINCSKTASISPLLAVCQRNHITADSFVCPQCGLVHITDTEESFVCAECGLVLGSKYDFSPPLITDQSPLHDEPVHNHTKYRTIFNPNENLSRLDNKINYHKYRHLRRVQFSYQSPTPTIRNDQFFWIRWQQHIGEVHIPPQLIQDTHDLFLQAVQHRCLYSGSILVAMAVSLYLATKNQACIALPIHTIRQMFGVTPQEWQTMIRAFEQNQLYHVTLANPAQFVGTIQSVIPLEQPVINHALRILRAVAHQHFVSGRKPESITGAAVYLAAHKYGTPIGQKQIADTLHISEITLRTSARLITGYFAQKAGKKVKA